MFAKLSKLILDCRIIADDAGFTHTRGSLENTFSFLFFLTETFLVFSLDADALSQIQNTKLKDNFLFGKINVYQGSISSTCLCAGPCVTNFFLLSPYRND